MKKREKKVRGQIGARTIKPSITHKQLSPFSEEGKIRKPLTPGLQEELNEKLLGAVIQNDLKSVENYLRLGGDVDYRLSKERNIKRIWYFENSTLLIIAAGLGHTDICKLLIENGANVDTQDKDGWTALMKAANNGHTDICKLLVEKGANVDTQNQGGWTALMRAAWNGHTDICKLLIENGANVNIQDKWGTTALILAAWHGHTDICKLLIEKGADVNLQNKDGVTVLMEAAQKGRTDTCNYLLSIGANPLLKDKDGKTAYDLAGKEEVKQIIKAFENIWKIFEGEQVLILMQNINAAIRECSPDKMYSIIANL